MSTTLGDAATFAVDIDARLPITAGIIAAAISILNEAGDQPNHLQRVALAARVIATPAVLAESFAWAISSNATTVGKWISGDQDGAIGDFAFVISTVWDAVAGVAAA